MVAGSMRANARTAKKEFFPFFMFYSPGFLMVNKKRCVNFRTDLKH
jgi:hypothetical protein